VRSRCAVFHTLTQLTMADAAWAWVVSQRFYRDNPGDTYDKYITKSNRWPTADEYCVENLGEICQMAQPNMVYLLRDLESLNKTGLKTGGISVGIHVPNVSNGHSITGARIALGSGLFANVYYDATPWVGGVGQNFSKTAVDRIVGFSSISHGGSLEKVSLELVASECSVEVILDNPQKMVKTIAPRPDDFRFPDGTYPLGENWREFRLGNFPMWPKLIEGREGAAMLKDHSLGWWPFKDWYKANGAAVVRFRATFDQAIQSLAR